MTQEIDAGVHLFTSEYWRQIAHCSTNHRGFNEKLKITLKLQTRQTASMGPAGRVQTGWVVCKMGRKLAKRLHSETGDGDQSVSSSGPHSSRKTQKNGRGSRGVPWPDLWAMTEGKRFPKEREISSLERTILRGISSHVSSNCSWVATKRTVFLRNFHSENNHSLEQHCMVMVEPPPLDVFQMWQGRFLHNPLLAALLTKDWVGWTLDISSNVGYSVQMKS